MKQFWSVFPNGFLEDLKKFEVCSLLSSVICSYVGELESLGRGWKHKPRAQIKSSQKDSRKKNDPEEEVMQWFSSFSDKVLHLQFFQKAFLCKG